MTKTFVDLKPLKLPLSVYVSLRSALYTVEGLSIPAIDLMVNRRKPRMLTDNKALFMAARSCMDALCRQDIQNIIDGVYPLEVLKPKGPIRHFMRIPTLFREGFMAARRRTKNEAREFSKEARELLSELPDYYQRNFHFQTSGYLSEKSAELYDHQVDVLFAGAADAMRRLIIKPLRERFPQSDGEGLTFLEVGSGTGQATLFVRMAFPKAKIVSVDLSAPYLKKAQQKLRRYPRHDFVEADAGALPFRDSVFDAVYSIFLFHELPMEARRQVIGESLRVVKGGGFVGLVDSLQLKDVPELDEALRQFPKDYHEPFYKSYISHPMEALFEEFGLEGIDAETGFFSKVVWAAKETRSKERVQ